MSIILINCHELSTNILAKLTDISAMENAPPRIEVAPSVFIDKEPVLSAMESDLKTMYYKLGEQLKRL